MAQSVCATVKIEIEQELTLERQAFDAHMRINNGLTGINLEKVSVEVNFENQAGETVLASSDPNHPSARFFIRVDSMTNINDISGNGQVNAGSSADIHWLIIPAPGAGGETPAGLVYFVGASLTYTLSGEEYVHNVEPDFITVKPMPELIIDYFLPNEVIGDDPFSDAIEPPVPFSLGVRIFNNGHGPAQNLKIDSGQPKIVENESDLLIGFEILGSEVHGRDATPSLLVDFGDVEAQSTMVARWQMIATLTGRFVEFGATFSHADELGGELTSLIQSINTHLMVGDVLVDLPGRDAVRDFLAADGDVYRVYESQTGETDVANLSESATINGSGAAYTITAPNEPGFVYMRLTDPKHGVELVREVVRSDGKRISPHNYWLSQRFNKERQEWDYSFNLFDIEKGSHTYTVYFEAVDLNINRPPVLGFISDKTARVDEVLDFIVIADDPNGATPTLSTGPLPFGLSFSPFGEAVGRFRWTPTQSQVGIYTVRVTASDGELSDSQTFQITVTGDNPPNQPPVAVDRTVTPTEDQIFRGYLPVSDPDGDPLTFSILSQPETGVVTLLENGQYQFTPNPDADTAATFIFTANDGQVDSNLGNITVAIRPVNDAPSALSGELSVVSGAGADPYTPQITDPDTGETFTLTLTSGPDHGTAQIIENQLVYTADAGYVGADSLQIQAVDSGGLAVTGSVAVTVTAPPVDWIAGALNVDMSAFPAASAVLTFENTASQSQTVDVELRLAQVGVDRVLATQTVTADPGSGQVAFNLDLTGVSGPLVLYAVMDSSRNALELNELNNSVGTSLLAGDTSPGAVALIQHHTYPATVCANETIVLGGHANYRLADQGLDTAQPARGLDLNVQLRRTADDSVVLEGVTRTDDHGAWFLEVTPPDEDNLVWDIQLADAATTSSLTVPLATTACDPPADGTADGTPAFPDAPYPGPDGGPALVSITHPGGDAPWRVTPGAPVPTDLSGNAGDRSGNGLGQTPVADGPDFGTLGGAVDPAAFNAAVVTAVVSNDSPTVGELIHLAFQVDANDSYYGLPPRLRITDPDGQTIDAGQVARYYLNGALQGMVAFRPHREGSFSLTLDLGDGFVDADDSDNRQTLVLNVVSDNQAPIAAEENLGLDEDNVLAAVLTAADPNGDDLTFTVIAQPTKGTLSLDDPNTGAFTYTPTADFNGMDGFTFQANDGALDSAPATVTLTVHPVNDAPVIEVTRGGYTTLENQPVSGAPNLSDVDGDPLVVTISQNGALGSAVLNDPATGAFTYTPNPGVNGVDQFILTASDGVLTSQPATVIVSIGAVNDAPIANAMTLTTQEDTILSAVLDGSDPDEDPLTFTILTPPTAGQLTLDNAATGAFSYTPDADSNGTDSFTWRVSDGQQNATASVTLTVTPVNDAPVADDQSLTVDAGETLTITLTATDVDGDTLTYTIATPPSLGHLTPLGGAAFSYTAQADAEGTDSFTFVADDGMVQSAVATVTLAVMAGNSPPIAENVTVIMNAGATFNGRLQASDPDGDALTYTITTPPQNGAVTLLDLNTGDFALTPDADWFGADSFTYSASDGSAAQSATVHITVGGAVGFLSGALSVTSESVPAGDAFEVSVHLANSARPDLAFTRLVRLVDGEGIRVEDAASVNVSGGGSLNQTLALDTASLPTGGYTLTLTALLDGVETALATLPVTVLDGDPCGACTGVTISVSGAVTVDFASGTPVYDGDPVLEPFVTYIQDGTAPADWRVRFDLAGKDLQFQPGSSLVIQGPETGTPGLELMGICELVVENDAEIRVQSQNADTGDLVIATSDAIHIDGRIQNRDDGTWGWTGDLQIRAACGDITLSQTGAVVLRGSQQGGGDIMVEAEKGNLISHGLIDAFFQYGDSPDIHLTALEGGVSIDGNTYLGLAEWTSRPIFTGVYLRCESQSPVGSLHVRAGGDIQVQGFGRYDMWDQSQTDMVLDLPLNNHAVVPVNLHLADIDGGVRATLTIPPGSGILRGFFGNATESLDLSTLNAVGDDVSQQYFTRDGVDGIAGYWMAHPGGWDYGLGWKTNGGAAEVSQTFDIMGPDLTWQDLLAPQFLGYGFGVMVETGEGLLKIGCRAPQFDKQLQFGTLAARSNHGAAGQIELVSTGGGIHLIDYALDNSSPDAGAGLVHLDAWDTVRLSVSNTLAAQNEGGREVIRHDGLSLNGGATQIQSRNGGIVIEPGVRVVANGAVSPGGNSLISCTGVQNQGVVAPADMDPGDDTGFCLDPVTAGLFSGTRAGRGSLTSDPSTLLDPDRIQIMAYYPMDDGLPLDYSKRKDHGNATGDLGVTAGKYGDAAAFFGQETVSFDTGFPFRDHADVSLTFWMRADTYLRQTVWESVGQGAVMALRLSDGVLSLMVQHADQTPFTVISYDKLASSEWHHLGLVREFKRYTLYHNGRIVAWADASQLPDHRVGSWRLSGADHPYKGDLDELLICRPALSLAEVKAVHSLNQGTPSVVYAFDTTKRLVPFQQMLSRYRQTIPKKNQSYIKEAPNSSNSPTSGDSDLSHVDKMVQTKRTEKSKQKEGNKRGEGPEPAGPKPRNFKPEGLKEFKDE